MGEKCKHVQNPQAQLFAQLISNMRVLYRDKHLKNDCTCFSSTDPKDLRRYIDYNSQWIVQLEKRADYTTEEINKTIIALIDALDQLKHRIDELESLK